MKSMARKVLEAAQEAKGKEKNEEVDVKKVIADIIDTDWGGSNEDQGRAVQLLRGIAFSDDPLSNKFMQDLSDLTGKMDKEDYK